MAYVRIGSHMIQVPQKQKTALDLLNHDYRIVGKAASGTLILEVPKHIDRTERRVVTDEGQVV